MRVAVFCEKSGVVRRAFRARGHDAWSFDLMPSDDNSPHNVIGDCTPYVTADWDLAICHPVCRTIANSGVRWVHDPKCSLRWIELWQDIQFFRLFLDAPISRKCVENSRPHGHTFGLIPQPTQRIQPWMFGHLESKETCLWLDGLPPLRPTNDVEWMMKQLPKTVTHKVHHMPAVPLYPALRAVTYEGVAEAMAEQWG